MMKSTAATLVVISGCSGGGKSSLLTELQARGYAIVEESLPPKVDVKARADFVLQTLGQP
jgi:predicted ATPase